MSLTQTLRLHLCRNLQQSHRIENASTAPARRYCEESILSMATLGLSHALEEEEAVFPSPSGGSLSRIHFSNSSISLGSAEWPRPG